ncbi:MAG: Outer-membrane lipoprotein LolB [Candidatus Erwinia impunctatus]|nr:Outer-membrane lipoprotein LolB [Culicoides impunctatus]
MSFTCHRFLRLLPLSALLLAACQITSPPKPGPELTAPQWLSQQQTLKKITQFSTRGSFAYISDNQRVYARFNWQQTASDRYRLLLTNPLGTTELQLDAQGSVVQLVDSNGKRYTSNDAEKMLSTLTGMEIPLDNLRQWVLGLPGSSTQYTLDSQYRLRQLSYHSGNKEWQVNWQSYDTQQTPALPSNVELQQVGQRIKLKMDSWTVQ